MKLWIGGILLVAGCAVQPDPVTERAATISGDIQTIEAMCRVEANSDWAGWYKQLLPLRANVDQRITAGLKAPRKSKDTTALAHQFIGCGGEPFLCIDTTSALFITLYNFKDPTIQTDPAEWIRNHPAKQSIGKLTEFFRAQGIDLIILPVPQPGEIYPDRLVSEPGLVPRSRIIAPHIQKLFREMMQANVEVVNVLPSLLQAATPGSALLWRSTDSHWAEPAEVIAVNEVSKRLKRYPFVQRALQASPLYDGVESSYVHGGMFRRYLTSEEESRAMPLINFKATKVTPRAGGDFKYVANSPILVVGDSFTHSVVTGTGFGPKLALATNSTVNLLSFSGSTIEPFRELFRDPELLKTTKVIIWVLGEVGFVNPGAYPANLVTPPIKGVQ